MNLRDGLASLGHKAGGTSLRDIESDIARQHTQSDIRT